MPGKDLRPVNQKTSQHKFPSCANAVIDASYLKRKESKKKNERLHDYRMFHLSFISSLSVSFI